MQLKLPSSGGSRLQLLNTVVTYASEGDSRGNLRARPKGLSSTWCVGGWDHRAGASATGLL